MVITAQTLALAMQTLRDNDIDVQDWDGLVYCYEWEAPQLLAAGIRPEHLVVVPREVPKN